MVRSIWTFGGPIGHIGHVGSAYIRRDDLVNYLTFWTCWSGQFRHLVDRLAMSDMLVWPIGQVWLSIGLKDISVWPIEWNLGPIRVNGS